VSIPIGPTSGCVLRRNHGNLEELTMPRLLGLVLAGGLVLGTASAARAQIGVSIGNPYRGGGVYVGAPGFSYASPGYGYSSGYSGYAAPGYGYVAPGYAYSSGYSGYVAPGYGYGYPAYGYTAYRPVYRYPAYRTYRPFGGYGRRWWR
jgi:hypothetical protein